jgi:hypothetical protein
MAKQRHFDQLVDIALEETFPASDPPFFMGGAVASGSLPAKRSRRRKPETEEPEDE